MLIDAPVKEHFQLRLEPPHLRPGTDQRSGNVAHVVHGADALLAQALPRLLQQVADLPVDERAHDGRLKLLRPQVAVPLPHLLAARRQNATSCRSSGEIRPTLRASSTSWAS